MTDIKKLWEKILTDVSKNWEEYQKAAKKVQITENSLGLSLKQVHKLQKFYTDWVEPLKKVMPSELFKSWDEIVKEYSLLEADK